MAKRKTNSIEYKEEEMKVDIIVEYKELHSCTEILEGYYFEIGM